MCHLQAHVTTASFLLQSSWIDCHLSVILRNISNDISRNKFLSGPLPHLPLLDKCTYITR
ncbi:hypothetical protein CW304_03365 [Bacillus sp. UFRGS-B20]|nr:hypothetical protein CW304_03365 [Bacillus sp. UFRGS-B20]